MLKGNFRDRLFSNNAIINRFGNLIFLAVRLFIILLKEFIYSSKLPLLLDRVVLINSLVRRNSLLNPLDLYKSLS